MLNVVAYHFDGILRFPAPDLRNVSREEDCLAKLDKFFTNESKLDFLDDLFWLSFLLLFHSVKKNNNQGNHFQALT